MRMSRGIDEQRRYPAAAANRINELGDLTITGALAASNYLSSSAGCLRWTEISCLSSVATRATMQFANRIPTEQVRFFLPRPKPSNEHGNSSPLVERVRFTDRGKPDKWRKP